MSEYNLCKAVNILEFINLCDDGTKTPKKDFPQFGSKILPGTNYSRQQLADENTALRRELNLSDYSAYLRDLSILNGRLISVSKAVSSLRKAIKANDYPKIEVLKDSIKLKGLNYKLNSKTVENDLLAIIDHGYLDLLRTLPKIRTHNPIKVDANENWRPEKFFELVGYLRDFMRYPIDLDSSVFDFFTYLQKYDETVSNYID